MAENENIYLLNFYICLVLGQPLPATFQFASYKLCMPKRKFSLVDYVYVKQIALRAAQKQQKTLEICFVFLVFIHPLDGKYKVGSRRLGKAAVVTGVRCRSDESGHDKTQGKQDAEIQGVPSTVLKKVIYTGSWC